MNDKGKTKEQLVRELEDLRRKNAEPGKAETNRNRTEEALWESEVSYRNIFENAAEAIYLAQDGKIVFLNPRATTMIGYSNKELMATPFIEFIHPDDRDKVIDRHIRRMKGEEIPQHYDFRLIHKDGNVRWVELNVVAINWKGKTATLNFLTDITERKLAEEALEVLLKENESLLHSLLNYMHDAMLIIDWDGSILFANQVASKIMELENPEEFFGHNMVEYLHPDSFQKAAEDLEAVKADKMGFPSEYQLYSVTGRPIWVESIGGKILFHNVSANLVCIRDITERKQAEEVLRESEESYRNLFENANEAIFVGLDSKIAFHNPKTTMILGYSGEELLSRPLSEFIHPDDRNRVIDYFVRQIKGEMIPQVYDFRIIQKDGNVRWVVLNSVMINWKGRPATLNFLNDITDRKQAEEELRLSEQRFKRIFDEGPAGMILVSPDCRIVTANKVFCGLLGYDKQEIIGQNFLDLTYKEDREKNRKFSEQLFAGTIPVYRLEKRYVRKDGVIAWTNVTASAIHGKEGDVIYNLALIEDLTESKKAAEKIHLLHYYDSLTGLPNRTFYKELIKRSIEHAQRHKEKFAIIYFGLDNFQRINDTLGYNTGDLLLKAVADRLADSLRKSDLVARSDAGETVNVVSRVGGDEFIALAHDLNQAQDAARTSRRLLEEISAPYDLSGREVFITVSIGIALYPDDGRDVDDLLKNAEKAMRYTKSEGKNNYHFYSTSMHASVLELLTLENDLHKVLERNELVLYYQPKVDAATRMVKGMEALIRWKHPERGLIEPLQFIPLAETSGLILPIGEFVIRTVCWQIKSWQEAGYQQMNISLNVSSRQFDQKNLIEIIKEALQEAMIPPQHLELEITESTMMRNPEKAVRTLIELKALGLEIAIDDFGTGYSSLSYLKRLPLDFLKIDQSFVKSLASDPRDQAIVRAMIAMARGLNLKTIAEGVETEEQLSFLQEHGCDEIQGYLFSRPLPAEEIPAILAEGYL